MTKLVKIAVLAGLVLAGCQPVPPSQPSSRDEAGSVLLTVSSVAPWSQVSTALQPNFTAKADSLLTSVVAATQRTQEQVLQAFGLAAGLSFQQTYTSGQVGLAPGSSNTLARVTGAPANPASLTPPSLPATTLPSAVNPIPSTDPGIDPLLQYQAARNLYQSIVLMNNEMQALSTGSCYTPYLVMAKLAVTPYRENVNKVVQARISFFPQPIGPYKSTQQSDSSGQAAGSQAQAGGTPPVTPRVFGISATKENPGSQKQPGQPATACIKTTFLPRVVPILATDDLERAVRNSSQLLAKQLSFALNGIFNGIGGNLGLNDLNQALNAINGADFNNRMSLSRESDNTVLIRINPSYTIADPSPSAVGTSRSLVQQSYDLALVILVPNAYVIDANNGAPDRDYIQIYSETEFRDPVTDLALPGRSSDTLGLQTKDVFGRLITNKNTKDLFGRLIPDNSLPSTPAFDQTWRIYNNLSNDSWARIGEAMIYLQHRDAYDEFSDLMDIGLQNSGQNINGSVDSCWNISNQKSTVGLTFKFSLGETSLDPSHYPESIRGSRFFGLPANLMLDDASLCFMWTLREAVTGSIPSTTPTPWRTDARPLTTVASLEFRDTRFIPALWTGASRLQSDSDSQVVLAPLPRQELTIPTQSVVITKDGKGGASGEIVNVIGSMAYPLHVTLNIPSRPAGKGAPPAAAVRLDSGATFDPGSHTISFSFPGLAQLWAGKDGEAGTINLTKVCLQSQQNDCDNLPVKIPSSFTAYIVTAPKTDAANPPGANPAAAASQAACSAPAVTAASAGGNNKATFALLDSGAIADVQVTAANSGVMKVVFTQFSATQVKVTPDSHAEIDPARLPALGSMSGNSLALANPSVKTSANPTPTAPVSAKAPYAVDVPLRNLDPKFPFTLNFTDGADKPTTAAIAKICASLGPAVSP